MKLKGKIAVYSDNGSTIIRISDTESDFTKVVASILSSLCDEDVASKKISELENPKKEEDTPPDISNAIDETPDFLQESKKEDAVSPTSAPETSVPTENDDIVIHMGKYKGKKVSEILKEAKGRDYLLWLTSNYSGSQKDTMNKIKDYLAKHK